MKELNILIVGVGGQGTLLASVLLGNLAMNGGYDVKLSEVHGMAQRGGSVVTHVRMGEQEVCAPVIDRGGADIIVAFEMLEAYRWVEYLKKGGRVTAAAAAIGTILNLKPVLTIQGEKLDAYAKERGMKKARHTMIEAMQKEVRTRFKELYDNDNFKMCIAYSDVDDETLQGWVDEVEEAFPDKELLIRPLSLSIGCQIEQDTRALAGPKILLIYYE